LQEDLVTEVAAHLGVQVERVEMEHALKKPGNTTAWEAVIRADAFLSRGTRTDGEAAVAEARRAVALDPDYDAAHATLAAALGLLRQTRGGDDPGLEQEIAEHIRRARALDPTNPLVLCRIAGALGFLGKERDALPLADRAVALNPNLDIVRIGRGSILLRLGRWDEAIAELEAAERLAPRGIWTAISLFIRSAAHFHAGRFEQALDCVDQSLRLGDNPPRQIVRILCLAKLDRWEQAHDAMRHLRDSNPEMSFSHAEKLIRNSGYLGSNSGRIDEYVATVRRIWDATGGDA